MAGKKSKWKMRLLFLFGPPLLHAGYSVVSPFFEKTSEMKGEVDRLETKLKQIRTDSAAYSQNWQSEMARKEEQMAANIPNQLSPRDVMSYFATRFEKEHPQIEFSTLIPQPVTTSNLQADPETPSIKARLMRFQIRAKLPSSLLFTYLDHIEKYPGVFTLQELTLNSGGDGKRGESLSMDVGLDFYLTPKEWLPKIDGQETVLASTLNRTPASTQLSTFDWFEAAATEPQKPLSNEDENLLEKPKRQAVVPPPRLMLVKFVGGSIVVGDDLIEEGDWIKGWQVTSIDAREKTVSLKRGMLSKTLRFR